MRKINILLQEYGESHQNKTNKLIHWICVPLIFLSLVGLLWSIPSVFLKSLLTNSSPYINWASLILIFATLYYLVLSPVIALGMIFFSAGCLVIVNSLNQLSSVPLWVISIIIFALAWIGQFYGHKIEGKKPSFLKDIQFLLIGPAWLMHFIFKKTGIPY